jgi:D-alanyl-D-alanine carboxypeptidase/D-alanyl-D-alanine-endopeptidase (penicillin-binding protein 4)
MQLRILALICLFLAQPTLAQADIKDRVKALAPNGLVLVLDENGKPLVSQNADKTFVPASVAKIATAWLAMEVLGKDHRFETKFYLDDKRVLYVRGGGDPFLISEELELLAPKLLEATSKQAFTGIVIDTSYYPDDITIPGIEATDEAYDALNSALAVNFNTIAAIRKGKSVRSAEKQTPITPLAISQFHKRGPNGRGRISLNNEKPELSALYAGELLAAFIDKAGGKIDGNISIGRVPTELPPIYIHQQSRSLPEILTAMLLGSNNYITNQVFLEIGANRKGGPVSLEKSLEVASELFAKHGLSDGITLVEGSGISRDNKFTADGLAKLLHQFAPHAELLKKTRKGSGYKTGTLSDVKTLAGFAVTKNHGLVRFVISLKGNTGKLRFRLLEVIEKEL